MEVDDFLPLSALEHIVFCERQCALIHIDGVWIENHHTVAGQLLHQRADTPGEQVRPGIVISRGLDLWSTKLRLRGKADIVEFRAGVPFPVEYKKGTKRKKIHDDIQLCAQAMCLEEMLGVTIPQGAIYYGKTRRRRDVVFTAELRALVSSYSKQLQSLVQQGEIPAPVHDRRCNDCSLRAACLPERPQAQKNLTLAIREVLK